MSTYNENVYKELAIWQMKMLKKPSFSNKVASKIQNKINRIIPEKAHKAITAAIKGMVQAVLLGSKYTSGKPLAATSLEERERVVRKKIDNYKKTAAVSGAWTGAGGILLALVDFPILLSLKIKLLFEIASLYGYDVKDYRERLFILYIFQLAFSSAARRIEIFEQLTQWEENLPNLPEDINQLDWRTFQLEYRDYIDLAKMLQLVPGIGAIVGTVVNYNLVEKLGITAMQAYRMRQADEGKILDAGSKRLASLDE